MKTFKKLLALGLALVMTMAMGITAFAVTPADYSITVNGAKAGETYSAYKMFDLSVDDPTNPTAYRYTVNSAWASFADTDEFKAVFTVDNQGYVTSTATSSTTWSASSDLSKVADAAAKFAKDNSIAAAGTVKIAEGATTGKINLTEAGYYVVASTLGTRAMIETTPDAAAVSINEKNEEDTIDKQVKEDSTGAYGTSNDAEVGQLVEFKSTLNVVPRSINVKVHDTMTSGLTFTTGSIKIYTDADLTTELDASQYEIQATPDTGDTFTIQIKDTFAATATSTQTLYITYTATVNENAVVKDANGVAIVDQNNKTKVSFGDGTSSTEKTITTTTHKFEIKKHNSSNTVLAGAHFKLYIKTADAVEANEAEGIEAQDATYEEVKVVKIDDNNYRVATANETGVEIVTVASGNIVVWGVDSDTYYLEETVAPEGYNLLADKQEVKVDAANNTVADVLNSSGSELPSTGGMGTTIFYALGAVLVLGAGVLMVTRRRMAN